MDVSGDTDIHQHDEKLLGGADFHQHDEKLLGGADFHQHDGGGMSITVRV
ncbi:hypothetical protein [Glaciecola sp. 1036]